MIYHYLSLISDLGTKLICTAVLWPPLLRVVQAASIVGLLRHFTLKSFQAALSPRGTIWTVLYAGMGYASYLVYTQGGGTMALVLYSTQLLLNWAWTPIFFGQHNLKLASYEISALWLAVAACGVKFFSINKVAGMLFIPYLAWVSLATALTFDVWRRNGDRPEPVKTE